MPKAGDKVRLITRWEDDKKQQHTAETHPGKEVTVLKKHKGAYTVKVGNTAAVERASNVKPTKKPKGH